MTESTTIQRSILYPNGQCNECGQGLTVRRECQNQECGRYVVPAPDIVPGPQPTYRVETGPDGGSAVIMSWRPFEDQPEQERVIARDLTPEQAETRVADMREHDDGHLERGTRCLWRDTYACTCHTPARCRIHTR